jgi:hypothetical protein
MNNNFFQNVFLKTYYEVYLKCNFDWDSKILIIKFDTNKGPIWKSK